MNILLVTFDQFRGDCLSAAGHPLVETPHLDRLAADGVRLARHYSQAAPCAPGRACLYTGTYQLTNRVIANGTPLDDRFDNVARAARRAGYTPTLFGYTDTAVDPRTVPPGDPRLRTYQGVLPGFEIGVELLDDHRTWRQWLDAAGFAPTRSGRAAAASEPDRPAEFGVSAFLTNQVVAWLGRQDTAWFAHVSYFRPHPPYAAAGHWARRYRPDDVPDAAPAAAQRHPFHDRLLTGPMAAPADERARRIRAAQYFGMVSDVDEQLGRLRSALEDLGMWGDTLVVVTSDHGEQLGDQGLFGKGGFFEASYHVVGILRHPHHRPGTTVNDFTENVDILPTVCAAVGLDIPDQCDGDPLTPFLRGDTPAGWRRAAHWEFDWRPAGAAGANQPDHLAVLRTPDAAYVHFGDGTAAAFDLAADAGWGAQIVDPATRLALAEEMLTWRAGHADRTLTGMRLG